MTPGTCPVDVLAMRFLRRAYFSNLVEKLHTDYNVYCSVDKAGGPSFVSLPKGIRTDPSLGAYRTADPLKSFYFLGRERVAEGFSAAPPAERGPVCIIGARACDLRGMRILDGVFIDPEYGDPTYTRLRSTGLIISADCTDALDTCFCVAMGLEPHPAELFDANLSEVPGGWIVEAGSERGAELLNRCADLLEDVTEAQAAARDDRRRSMAERVRKLAEAAGTPSAASLAGRVAAKYEDPLWEEEARTCVECGACNTVCPTCHCFLLYDQSAGGGSARFRTWDSCLINDFARVAGGENPRRRLWMRLRNRFDKKFQFFPETKGLYACTGCGRCSTACPGDIDIRRVLRRLAADG